MIDQLSQEYDKVIVPQIVIDELDRIKDHGSPDLAPKAWQIIRSIGSNQNPNVIAMAYDGVRSVDINDKIIIAVAEVAAEQFHCAVDIITYDAGFAARLSGQKNIHSLFLEDYMAGKQVFSDVENLKKLDGYYADAYGNVSEVLGITALGDLNVYLANGNTLIISAVRNRDYPLKQRIAKIRWLIKNGADVNQRDCGRYYFPPLSHAIQINDLAMFKFLLHDCQANPNVGSRNPRDGGKIRQKNESNMPLMIAAWDNRIPFVRELCADPRTSLNQQDGNGFTALIKACYWGWVECRDILLAAGADEKIVDRDGCTAQDRYEEFLQTGRRKNMQFRKQPRTGGRR